MKYSKSNIIGDAGEHLVASRIINLFNFPCRLINIDIGIDAEIEIIDNNYKSTGEFIKSQIKTTTSDKFYIYIDDNHIKYWNKFNIPVVVFLVHLDTEDIYWHCVDNIKKYEKLDSGYRIDFDKSNILKKENKNMFLEISFFPLIQKIKKIYDESYKIVKEDNVNFLDNNNYDLVTFEDFVFHSNKIKYGLNEVEGLFRKNDSLRKINTEYYDKLDMISEYLNRIDEEKESILLDSGEDFYNYLDDLNYDWD